MSKVTQIKTGVMHEIREAEHPENLFTIIQLNEMKKQYTKLERIDDELWKRLKTMVNGLETNRPALYQIVAANIPFLSQIVAHWLRTGNYKRP
jgi:hypothetical protein